MNIVILHFFTCHTPLTWDQCTYSNYTFSMCHTPSPVINEYGQFTPFSPATPPLLGLMNIVNLYFFTCHTPSPEINGHSQITPFFTCHTPLPGIKEYRQFTYFSPAKPTYPGSMHMVNLHLFTFSPATPPHLGSMSMGNLHLFHLPHPLPQDQWAWTIYIFSPATPPHLESMNMHIFACYTPSPGNNEHGQFTSFQLPHPLILDQLKWIVHIVIF